MAVNVAIVIILALVFGIFFFLTNYFEQRLIKLHGSFIAGISVVYFFLVVLPEIAERLPESPFGFEIFEYLFVLITFIFIHINKKFILQKVESGLLSLNSLQTCYESAFKCIRSYKY